MCRCIVLAIVRDASRDFKLYLSDVGHPHSGEQHLAAEFILVLCVFIRFLEYYVGLSIYLLTIKYFSNKKKIMNFLFVYIIELRQ